MPQSDAISRGQAALQERKWSVARTQFESALKSGDDGNALEGLSDALVTAIDAAPELIEIAQTRTPTGDFRVGEMEELPFGDRQFDIVAGFNSFQYAASPANALREAKRVAKRDGRLVIAVWGGKDRCEAAVYLAALGSCLPPPPPGAPGPFALSAPGALESLINEAGWKPVKRAKAAVAFDYPDEETAMRGLLAAEPAVRAIQHAGEERVRSATLAAIKPFRKRNGGYRMENEFVYVIAQ